jgi:long-chain fatty acid transport protein
MSKRQTAVVALCAGLALPLAAQTNLETNAGVQFNFSTPGAGNMALGGAFLALAFDASAAYTNPAGLTTIAKPEALVEARHWNYTHVFTDKGRIQGEDIEGEPTFDTIRGLRNGEAENQVDGLSYISYVYPRRDWSFAVYRHELVNFAATFSTSGAYLQHTVQQSPYGIPGALEGRLASLQNNIDVDVIAYGSAAGYQLGHGLSLGLGISYFEFSIDSIARRFLPGDLLDPPSFSPEHLVNIQTQRGQDNDWGMTAGFLWESKQRRWSLGGIYREGPDFTFQATSRSARQPSDDFYFTPREQQASFHVPDVYGLGIAFRPRDTFRLALDYDRVRYSQLTDGFADIFGLAEAPFKKNPELNKFVIDDANEIHLGVEYAFLQSWPVLSLRAGAWYDPGHNLRFEGQNVGYQTVFRQHGDHMHYTFGAGLALRRIQIDAAVDHSERVSVLSLSMGLRH